MTRDERLSRLEEQQQTLSQRFQFLAEQLAEQNLRIRFVMHAIEMVRPVSGGIVGLDGQPQTEKTDLFQQYMQGGRDRLLMMLEQEMIDMQEQAKAFQEEEARKAGGNGQGTSHGEGQGTAPGEGTGAERPVDGGAQPDRPSPERANGPALGPRRVN